MTTQYPRRRDCRIYHSEELQSFNPNQPFSTVGGYADLFRASHAEDGELALKRPRWGTGDPTDRFALATQEAGVWQVLSHPNVLAFLGILYSSPHIYLVSRFASHGSLPQYLAAHPDAERTTFIIHIAAGLAYLHGQNVIHGDVKGANVLVSQRLTAQLCDFGFSKFAHTAISNIATGRSLPWLSPERMDRANSPRTKESDVYAFGMTIYEILSGLIPFHALGVDDLIIAVCIRDERPPASPETSTAGTSYTPLWLLAGNCWNKDPAKRSSMKQVHDHITPGDPTTVANTNCEDTQVPWSSSRATTIGQKRIYGIVNVRNTGKRAFIQDTEQSGESKMMAKRQKISKLPILNGRGPLAAEQVPRKTPDDWRSTAAEAVEVALRSLSKPKSSENSAIGSIFKLMAGSGLVIISNLKEAKENKEQAMELGRHVGTLIQCAARFLEKTNEDEKDEQDEQDSDQGIEKTEGGDYVTDVSVDAGTITQLESFLGTLKEAENTFVELHRHQLDVSHRSHRDVLKNLDATINYAFAALQIQLSLNSLRLVTNLGATSARHERDRLFGLLGDGDIGATEKASSAVDLMCLPGTRTAVLDQVDQWIVDSSGSRVLWISGVAGCGKSALAATIAGRPRAIPTSIAVFYLARGNQERNKRVLCSLSRQIAQFGHGSLERFVLSGVQARPDIATSHIDTQFQHMIVDPLKKLVPGSSPVVVVVDALDEWSNYDAVLTLLELIRAAHTQLPPTVRFILASRNEPHLVRALDSELMRPLITRYRLDAVLKSDAGRDIRRYIEKRFVKIGAQSGKNSKTWPEARDVENLVLLSDGLFQWAATVMSYIGARRSPGRLREILQNPERYRGLDNLYQGVLDASSREEMDDRFPRMLQNVLGAILTAPAPRDAITIAYLCCDELDTLEETLELIQEEVLPSLASMFFIPKDPMEPITASHKSVHDYLTDKDRCVDIRFHTDLAFHQERIIHSCFRLMGSKLKQNICGINDPSKINQNMPDQVAKHISTGLLYFCEHWVEYLATPGQGGFAASRDHLELFSESHLLHWLEVMSLAGLMERVVPMAQDVERWLMTFPSISPADDVTRRLWSDIQRFVAMFSNLISTAAAHIYISAIRLAPEDTEISRRFSKRTERGVRVMGGLLGKEWPPSPWTAKGHRGGVHCASFSPDGKTILSGSLDSSLRLWDASSGVSKGRPLEGHTDGVRCASFSPDGKKVLSGSFDGTLRLWDAVSGSQEGRALEGHTNAIWCASFWTDGRTILSGSDDNTLRMWNAESGVQEGGVLEGHVGAVRCASFSPDGKTIMSGSFDGTLRLWDVGSGAQTGGALGGHSGAVRCGSFSPNGRSTLSGSEDGTLRLWNAEFGEQEGRALRGHEGAVWCASFSPDGETILSGSSDITLRLWDVKSGVQKGREFKGHTGSVWCVSFSPDGRKILSGSEDGTMRLWNADPGALGAEPVYGHTRGVSCFAFSPDGSTVISGSYDKTVRLWEAETGALKGEPLRSSGVVSELSFSEDESTLIGKTCDGLSQEWDFKKYVHATAALVHRHPMFNGTASSEGWIFHRDIRWFWVPFSHADWLLCGSRLALRRERVVYILDVSEIMYIVE